MECQDATAHLADYRAGSLPVEELEALLTHAAACAACRDKLTATDHLFFFFFFFFGSAAARETFTGLLDAPLAIFPGSRVPGFAVADSLPIEPFERSRWGRARVPDDWAFHRRPAAVERGRLSLRERERRSQTDDRQKARTACNIGTQPLRPEVYGVKAPL